MALPRTATANIFRLSALHTTSTENCRAIGYNRSMIASQALALLKLSRPHFMPMSILPYFLGAGLVPQRLDQQLLAIGLIVQLLVQWSVSFLNDYWDIETDRINTQRTLLSGGSGELTTGILPRWVAMAAGLILQSIALLIAWGAGIPAWSWAILLLTMGLVHIYTMPPIKLVYRGWGEFTTASIAAIAVPSWAYSLQTETVSAEVLRWAIPLVPFMMGMMLAIATPDLSADRQVNKHTLAVIVGERHIATLYATLLGLGYGLMFLLLPLRFGLMVSALSLPLALWAWSGLRQPIKATATARLLMILRTGLVALVMLLAVTIRAWTA